MNKKILDLAMTYFRIRIWAAPAVLGQFALLGYFLGMQNAKLPMVVLITANLLNIACNFIFVMILGMGSAYSLPSSTLVPEGLSSGFLPTILM